MLDGMTLDELVAAVTVVHMSASECGIQEDMDSDHIKIVGRRKAMKFVFAHLVDGGICITQKIIVGGRAGTKIYLWSMKEVEEGEVDAKHNATH